jgi:hypothetical protein
MSSGFGKLALIPALLLLMGGCAIFGSDEELTSPEMIRTYAAQTREALATLGITETPDLPTLAVVTPTVTSLAVTPIPTLTPDNCDRAMYVQDITIPDGMMIEPGATFTKTWELKNAGTCAWTQGYSLVFTHGDAMGAPASQALNLSGNVEPNQTVQISIDLKAPTASGVYRNYFKLSNPYGKLFGIGKDGSGEFYVEIGVKSEVNFLDMLCDAVWRSGADVLPCQGEMTDVRGFVRKEDAPKFENGYADNEAALVMGPPQIVDGEVKGWFPVVEVPPKTRFRTIIGCLYEAVGCDVKLVVTYKVDGGAEQVLGEWTETYNGNVTSINLDLGSFNFSGKQVEFGFTLKANGGFEGDRFFMLMPRLAP